PWRFPARNRILAALADVVVVVESHLGGGSMHTVRAAEERGCVIMAVPGSVRNPASAGTNKLLSEGLPPARDTDDVLAALALATAGRYSSSPFALTAVASDHPDDPEDPEDAEEPAASQTPTDRPEPTGVNAAVLAA